MTQQERLLNYLNSDNSINPLQAWTQLGIYRLSDCVFRLKKTGVKIRTERMEISNRFNEVCNVANYVLEK
jgi:hypothetical protein